MKHFVLKSKNDDEKNDDDVDLRMSLGLISLLVLSFAAMLLLQRPLEQFVPSMINKLNILVAEIAESYWTPRPRRSPPDFISAPQARSNGFIAHSTEKYRGYGDLSRGARRSGSVRRLAVSRPIDECGLVRGRPICCREWKPICFCNHRDLELGTAVLAEQDFDLEVLDWIDDDGSCMWVKARINGELDEAGFFDWVAGRRDGGARVLFAVWNQAGLGAAIAGQRAGRQDRGAWLAGHRAARAIEARLKLDAGCLRTASFRKRLSLFRWR
jgi:hypothetical protein